MFKKGEENIWTKKVEKDIKEAKSIGCAKKAIKSFCKTIPIWKMKFDKHVLNSVSTLKKCNSSHSYMVIDVKITLISCTFNLLSLKKKYP